MRKWTLKEVRWLAQRYTDHNGWAGAQTGFLTPSPAPFSLWHTAQTKDRDFSETLGRELYRSMRNYSNNNLPSAKYVPVSVHSTFIEHLFMKPCTGCWSFNSDQNGKEETLALIELTFQIRVYKLRFQIRVSQSEHYWYVGRMVLWGDNTECILLCAIASTYRDASSTPLPVMTTPKCRQALPNILWLRIAVLDGRTGQWENEIKKALGLLSLLATWWPSFL